jgi:hypothetical protein
LPLAAIGINESIPTALADGRLHFQRKGRIRIQFINACKDAAIARKYWSTFLLRDAQRDGTRDKATLEEWDKLDRDTPLTPKLKPQVIFIITDREIVDVPTFSRVKPVFFQPTSTRMRLLISELPTLQTPVGRGQIPIPAVEHHPLMVMATALGVNRPVNVRTPMIVDLYFEATALELHERIVLALSAYQK